MPRLSQSDKHRIRNRIMSLHYSRIAKARAEELVASFAPIHMPACLRTVIRKGLADCLETGCAVEVDGFRTWTYRGVNAESLAADRDLIKRLRTVYPKRMRVNSHHLEWRARREIMGRIERYTTHAACLKAFPELQPIFDSMHGERLNADQKTKLRRKLLRAGWPLNSARTDA